MELLLGIDQGTSGLKTALFTLQGEVIGAVTKSYKTYHEGVLGVQQNPEDWWGAVVDGVKELFAKTGTSGADVIAIGVDGTSWACIPMTHEGEVLHPAMMWLDRRSEAEAQWMQEVVGADTLWNLSKNPADPSYITPKMIWLQRNMPAVYQKTDLFVQSNSYLVYRFTGEFSQDFSQGYGFHFFDMAHRRLDAAVARALGLSADLVAPLMDSHTVVGGVLPEVAAATGLAPGTPVVAGGLDAACGTLGAGVINLGETQEQGGQAGGMSIALDAPLATKELILGCHVVPDRWLLQGGTTGGGGALRWFASEFGAASSASLVADSAVPATPVSGSTAKGMTNLVTPPSGSAGRDTTGTPKGNLFAQLDAEAATVPAGSDGVLFLPYMKGERSPLWNSHAKGVFYGLSFDKGRRHMVRALMEGVAYALQHNLECAYRAGADVKQLVTVGGAGESKLWTQIKSDITGRPISTTNAAHATALGSAMLAGMGVGAFESAEDARAHMVTTQRHHEPNPDIQEAYAQGYKQYKKLSDLLQQELFTEA